MLDRTTLLMLGAGVALYLFLRPRDTFAVPAPTGTPLEWWIGSSGDLGTLTRTAPRLTPPAPGFRPASNYELESAAAEGLI